MHGGERDDLTDSGAISQATFVSIGCSDGFIRLISIDGLSYTEIETIRGVPVESENDAVLYHDLNNCTNKAITGTQNGALALIDIEQS